VPQQQRDDGTDERELDEPLGEIDQRLLGEQALEPNYPRISRDSVKAIGRLANERLTKPAHAESASAAVWVAQGRAERTSEAPAAAGRAPQRLCPYQYAALLSKL
jgi:hypothetical protein